MTGVEQQPEALVRHLQSWLGAWPPRSAVDVVANPALLRPSWDGGAPSPHGVVDATGAAVFGIPPEVADAVVAAGLRDLDDLDERLPALLGVPEARVFRGVMRWTVDPTALPEAGVWLGVDDPRVPPWLHPFGGEVLVALEDDRYVAGVGIKKHDRWGQELAVVTDEAARGRGLARRLVAQAARRVVDGGSVATYLHADANVGSARVADAAGFPDRGWQILGLFHQDPGA